MSDVTYVTCRGSYLLGTACGRCSQCEAEARQRSERLEAREVYALGQSIGFGRLMQLAEQEWRRYLDATCSPLGGEFTTGPCRAALDRRGLRDCMHMLDEYDRMHRALYGEKT